MFITSVYMRIKLKINGRSDNTFLPISFGNYRCDAYDKGFRRSRLIRKCIIFDVHISWDPPLHHATDVDI